MIVYSYSRPLIKRCAKEYDPKSKEKAAHICNTAIVKKTISESSQTNKDVKINIKNYLIYLYTHIIRVSRRKNFSLIGTLKDSRIDYY